MRLATTVFLAAAALTACKSANNRAGVRDAPAEGSGGDVVAADLGAQLSKLAAALKIDFDRLGASDVIGATTNGDVLALADEKPLTPEQLDALRKQVADLNALYRRQVAAADRANAERTAILARLNERLESTTRALSQIDPADTARYAQGLADVRLVADEMTAATAGAGSGSASAAPARAPVPPPDTGPVTLICRANGGKLSLYAVKQVGGAPVETEIGVSGRTYYWEVDCHTAIVRRIGDYTCAPDGLNYSIYNVRTNKLALYVLQSMSSCEESLAQITPTTVYGCNKYAGWRQIQRLADGAICKSGGDDANKTGLFRDYDSCQAAIRAGSFQFQP